MDGNKLSSTAPQPLLPVRRKNKVPLVNGRIEGRSDLPLLELFTSLREAGFPLGIDEYQLVLKALQAGFGISDQAALKRLCQTLWVKSAEEKQLFEYQFEQIMEAEAVLQTAAKLSKLPDKQQISWITRCVIIGFLGVGIVLGVGFIFNKLRPTSTVQVTETPKPNTNPNTPNWFFWTLLPTIALSGGYVIFRWTVRQNTKQPIGQSNSHPEVTSSPAKLTQIIEDEVQVAESVLQATKSNEEIPYSRFIFNSEYLPITERQLKQIWRYLRRPVREGPRIELDVEATVNEIGRQGLLLQPIFVPRRVNQSKLLLLIDQDGSMVPFHTLSQRIAETALRGGRLGKSGIYYFHNCPIEYLYHDPYHQQVELVSHIITYVCSDKTAVLIFSDAGAARRGYSEERYKLTKKFLAQLQQQVRYIAWLNPMPRKRWLGTTADAIASLVPMFEVNRRGVQDAIDVLRGYPTNIEGLRK